MVPQDGTSQSQPPSKPPPVHKHKQSTSRPTLLSLESMTRDQVSRYAITASIDGGGFEDVKFFAFSRRTSQGKVVAPMPLFGNSTCIRKTAPHFDMVLTQGFAESVMADLNEGYPSDRPAALDHYDYADDSDIEDSEDEPRPIASTAEDEDREPRLEDSDNPVRPQGALRGSDAGARHVASGRPGRIVFLEDVAYRTWRAFIYYTYFDTISFAPLKSQQNATSDKGKDTAGPGAFNPPECSPKSMYRLAEKYDIKELKTKAVADIQSKLSPDNIFTELFSPFTSLHAELQELEVGYLHSILGKPAVMQELSVWIDYLSQGRLPVAASKAVASLISRLTTAQPGAANCPSCSRIPSNYCKHCKKYV
ncbi:hypothetical protein C8Q74DRAFT_716517 [Fomes fomentarius]|nr:hypothetical protein C8Q74DRAFT_716517 [Fomes fomentarius]